MTVVADGATARLWRTHRLRVAFAVSVLINLSFAVRLVVFEQYVQVKPICWTNHDGLVVLDGPQTFRYMDAFRDVGGRYDIRLDAEGYYYVSLLDYWLNEEYFWNATMKIVNWLVWEHGDEMNLPPYKIEGPDRVKVTCELTRAVAIEASPDQQSLQIAR